MAVGVRNALLLLVAGLLLAAPAAAECVDLNAAPPDELARIVHIDETRAAAIVAGRPWPDVRALTRVQGIGPGRVGDIADQGLACVGYGVPAGARGHPRPGGGVRRRHL